MAAIADNLLQIRERIAQAAERSGRQSDAIRLLAVTKTVSADRIRESASAGVTDAGENRLQEALGKQTELRDISLTWHFIGRVQTNKARKIAETFDWVHSVDRIEVAEKLEAAASAKRLPILIEVSLAGEAAKGGASEESLPELVAAVRARPNLDLRGFMTVPPFFENPEDARPYFRRLKRLADVNGLPELSMGMSHDFEVAIEEGATIVRIGTALFGSRT